MRPLILSFILVLYGCTTTLTKEGKDIAPISESNKNECEFISQTIGTDSFGGTLGHRLENAMNDMRNKVASLGGDSYVVTSSESYPIGGATVSAEVYNCSNASAAIKQGVDIEGNLFTSTYCYSYTSDEGRISAKKRVKNLAYSEAIEAIKTRVESKTNIRKESNNGKVNSTMSTEVNTISLNIYKNSDVEYILDSSNKLCVKVNGEIEDL